MISQMLSLGGFLMLLIGVMFAGFFMGLWQRARSAVSG